MKHYSFGSEFHALYDLAIARYAHGKQAVEGFFTGEELAFLAANGITGQHLFDYVEDHNKYGEPGFEIALSIESVRRDYFLNAQNGRASGTIIEMSALPAKTDAVRGIAWLPRLLPKARAKLRGELPASLMFCCGGDRAFFQQHDIYPAEFLSLLWREPNDAAVADWVVRRRAVKV